MWIPAGEIAEHDSLQKYHVGPCPNGFGKIDGCVQPDGGALVNPIETLTVIRIQGDISITTDNGKFDKGRNEAT